MRAVTSAIIKAPKPTAPRRARPRKSKPALVGKRGARLLDNPCIHRTTTAGDICLQCGAHVPDEAPATPGARGPAPVPIAAIPTRGGRGPVLIPSSPNREIHLTVARFIAGRKRPLTATNIAAHLGLDTSLITDSLQELQRCELVAQPRGEYTRHWVATAMLRNRGVQA